MSGTKAKPPLQIVADAAFGSNMTPTQKLIAFCVAWHVNRGTGEAFPSDARIAQLTGFCSRTVRAAVPFLWKAQLCVSRRGGSARRIISRARTPGTVGAAETRASKKALGDRFVEFIRGSTGCTGGCTFVSTSAVAPGWNRTMASI